MKKAADPSAEPESGMEGEGGYQGPLTDHTIHSVRQGMGERKGRGGGIFKNMNNFVVT